MYNLNKRESAPSINPKNGGSTVFAEFRGDVSVGEAVGRVVERVLENVEPEAAESDGALRPRRGDSHSARVDVELRSLSQTTLDALRQVAAKIRQLLHPPLLLRLWLLVVIVIVAVLYSL